MTGQEFINRYKTVYDEYNGYYDPAKLQRFTDTATSNIFQKKVDLYDVGSPASNDLLPFLKVASVTPSVGNIIDVSATSVAVPNYKKFTSGLATYVVNGASIIRPLSQLKEVFRGNFYGNGTVDYPTYEKLNDTFIINPTSITCTNVNFRYIRTFIQIVITDTLVQIPYNDDFANEILTEMKQLVAAANREPLEAQLAAAEQQRNATN